MNKIGVSLPWDYLSENDITREAPEVREVFGPPAEGLDFLKKLGVTSIELRHLELELTKNDMRRSLSRVEESGLEITIHSEDPPDSGNWSVSDLFPWLKIVEETGVLSQTSITIALHPMKASGGTSTETLKNSTVRMISELAERQKNWKLRYHIALENQRVKGMVDPGTSFDAIHSMWKTIDSPEIGVCWDFGHGYANYLKNGHPLMPSDEFINSVTHTHIHDLGPTGATHWPFIEKKVPLEKYIARLKDRGYDGVYNLELGFDRFADIPERRKVIEDTINNVKELLA